MSLGELLERPPDPANLNLWLQKVPYAAYLGITARVFGNDVIFDDHPLHRCFQDIRALTQQIQARPAHFRTVGRVLLGLDPDNAVL